MCTRGTVNVAPCGLLAQAPLLCYAQNHNPEGFPEGEPEEISRKGILSRFPRGKSMRDERIVLVKKECDQVLWTMAVR